jgi:hypothetical protein
MSTFIIILIIIAAILAGVVMWVRSLPPVGRVHVVVTDKKRFEMPPRDEDFVPEPIEQ